MRVLVGARGADADALEQLVDALAHGLAVGVGIVQADGVADLARDALHRVERVERALEDERHLAPAQVAHAALGAAVHVHDAVVGGQVDRPREAPQAGSQELQHGQRGRRLAAARLARQAERLAASQLEGDARDDLDVAIADGVADPQVVHAQHGSSIIAAPAPSGPRSPR